MSLFDMTLVLLVLRRDLRLCTYSRTTRFRWTKLSKIPSSNPGPLLYSNNAKYTNLLKLCIILRKYLFRHAKGKSMVNFYIVNALGPNLANSESCPILRLL